MGTRKTVKIDQMKLLQQQVDLRCLSQESSAKKLPIHLHHSPTIIWQLTKQCLTKLVFPT